MQLPAPRYAGCPPHPFPQGEGDSGLKGNWDVWAPNRPPHKGCIRGRDPVNYRCAMLSGISSNREMYAHTDMRPRHEMGIVCKSMRPMPYAPHYFPVNMNHTLELILPQFFRLACWVDAPCPVVSGAPYTSTFCALILFPIIGKFLRFLISFTFISFFTALTPCFL